MEKNSGIGMAKSWKKRGSKRSCGKGDMGV
jgi:hypothetical protein